MELFSPATGDEAVALLTAQAPTFATRSHTVLFREDLLRRGFERGTRRPELVWAVRLPDDGPVLGLVGARTRGDRLGLVDLLALPVDPAAASLSLGAATAWARSLPRAEATFSVPPAEDPIAEPATRAVVGAFEEHGWRVLVTRKHYAVTPYEGLADGVATVPLESAGPAGRDRVEAFVRRMLPGSLDVRDRATVAAKGLEAAAKEGAASLLNDDPVECFRFLVVDGQDAGLVVYRTMPDGTGYLAQVGVAEAFRGRGLAAALVATATRALVAQGATTLVAGTDDGNRPMVRAFERAGWRPSESRVDLELP